MKGLAIRSLIFVIALFALGCGGTQAETVQILHRMLQVGDQWKLTGTFEFDGVTKPFEENIEVVPIDYKGKNTLLLKSSRSLDGEDPYVDGIAFYQPSDTQSIRSLASFSHDHLYALNDVEYVPGRLKNGIKWKRSNSGTWDECEVVDSEVRNTTFGNLALYRIKVYRQTPIEAYSLHDGWYSPALGSYVSLDIKTVVWWTETPDRNTHIELQSVDLVK